MWKPVRFRARFLRDKTRDSLWSTWCVPGRWCDALSSLLLPCSLFPVRLEYFANFSHVFLVLGSCMNSWRSESWKFFSFFIFINYMPCTLLYIHIFLISCTCIPPSITILLYYCQHHMLPSYLRRYEKPNTDYRIIINNFINIQVCRYLACCLVIASLKTDDDITRRLSESERFNVDRFLNRKFNQNDAIESALNFIIEESRMRKRMTR